MKWENKKDRGILLFLPVKQSIGFVGVGDLCYPVPGSVEG